MPYAFEGKCPLGEHAVVPFQQVANTHQFHGHFIVCPVPGLLEAFHSVANVMAKPENPVGHDVDILRVYRLGLRRTDIEKQDSHAQADEYEWFPHGIVPYGCLGGVVALSENPTGTSDKSHDSTSAFNDPSQTHSKLNP